MIYNPDIHHRKSIRLKGHDYSKSGLYFITICTYEGLNFLGKIEKGKMIFNEYGKIAEEEILKTAEIRKNIEIDGYCIMPNHIHMIIEIKEMELEATDEKEEKSGGKTGQMQKAGHEHRARTEEKEGKYVGARCPCPENQKEQYGKPTKNTIPTIIRAIKASVTKRINKLNNSTETVIWHRNYYENIIRNEEVYLKVSEYIENNPKRWEEDRYYKMGKKQEK